MDTQAGLNQRSSEVKYLILLMQGLTDIEGMSMMEEKIIELKEKMITRIRYYMLLISVCYTTFHAIHFSNLVV